MPVRLPALLLQAAVALALVLGTTAFVTHDKTVTVSVDGRSTEVRTFGGTVGEVLAAEDIEVDLEHDLVTPMPDEGLRNGETIVVRYGRPVELTVDGKSRRVWTTARNVSEALRALGVRGDGAYVSASRSRRINRAGLALDVRLPRHVTFLADGKRHEVTTTAPTLGDALAESGLSLRKKDRVDGDLAQLPYPEQVVGVTRVRGKRVMVEKAIQFRTIKRKSQDLFVGQTKVLTAGQVGIRQRRFVETYLDGELDSRRLVQTRVAAAPVTAVILVGTKPVPQNSPTADGLNWTALARCESGGNPQAYNPAGPYYGLYQFAASTWSSVGGVGVPTDASASEQTYRAQILYRRSGAGQWPVCGRNLFT